MNEVTSTHSTETGSNKEGKGMSGSSFKINEVTAPGEGHAASSIRLSEVTPANIESMKKKGDARSQDILNDMIEKDKNRNDLRGKSGEIPVSKTTDKPTGTPPWNPTDSHVESPTRPDDLSSSHLEKKSSDARLETKDKALQELKLKEFKDADLRRVERECRKETFTDGHGREISKGQAVDQMVDTLSGALDKIGPDRGMTPEQKQAILGDVKRAIYSQEAENQSRAIGNHGIPHLHGVYERMMNTPDDVLEKSAAMIREREPGSKATAEDVRAGLVLAAALHDEGYLSERSRDVSDKTHGVDSAIAFEYKHADLLRGVVDDAVLRDVKSAIAEHNDAPNKVDKSGAPIEYGDARKAVIAEMENGKVIARDELKSYQESLNKVKEIEDKVKRHELTEADGEKAILETKADGRMLLGDEETVGDMDPNKNFIRSALLLSDRLALDASEKTPDVLRDPDRASMMISYYTQQMGSDDTMKQQMKAMIEADTSLPPDQKERYTAAVDHDMSTRSGYFNMPMSGVSTPADSLKFSLDAQGRIQAKVSIHERSGDPIYGGAFGDKVSDGKDMPGKQVGKAVEDFGASAEAMAALNGTYANGWTTVNADGTIVLNTSYTDEKTGTTAHIKGLGNVQIEMKGMDVETERPNPAYLDEAFNKNLEELNAQRDKKFAAEEAALAARQFREVKASGNVSVEALSDVCGSIYIQDEANRGRIDAIMKELSDPDIQPERVKELANICETMLPKDGEKE